MKGKRISYFFMFTILSSVAHSEIFKCRDLDGTVIYKDSECGVNELLQKVIHLPEQHKMERSSSGEIVEPAFKQTNLLKNSSFEQKVVDWRVKNDVFWTMNGGKGGSSAVIIQAKKPPEDRYIYETVISQCLELNGGEEYKLSADFMTDKPLSANKSSRVEVYWWESLDCKKNGHYGNNVRPKNTGGWQHIEVERLKPTLNAKAAQIQLVQLGRFSEGSKAYWDNISFSATVYNYRSPSAEDHKRSAKKLSPGENYLKNGSLDKKLNAWKLADGNPVWVANVGNKSKGSVYVTTISDTPNKWKVASPLAQCVNFGPHVRGEIGVSSLKDPKSNQEGSRSLKITWYEFENCEGRYKGDNRWAGLKEEEGWQHLKLTDLEIPENAMSVSISLSQAVKDKGTYSAYWDDIYFFGF